MPTDSEYLEALGRAIYRWALMEWDIIYLAEELNPAGRTVHRSATMTSGLVAQQLRSALAASTMSASVLADAENISAAYDALIPRRNDIVHAHPATIDGLQRLHRVRGDSTQESIQLDDLRAFTSECAGLARRANGLFWSLRRGERN
jgi:hypothetical protein